MSRTTKPQNTNNSLLLRPIKNESVVDRVFKRITDALITGELKPGQKIPTEMELSESMQVSRNSVREAIKILVAMGVLEIYRSEGTFVCQGFSSRMLDPMIYGLILQGDNAHIIELRRLFDIGVLELLVAKADNNFTNKVEIALQELTRVARASTPSSEDLLLDADIEFHKLLESGLDNPLIDNMSVVINRLTRPTRMLAVRHFLNNNKIDEFIKRHEEILCIIKNSNSADIITTIDAHFEYWSDAVNH